MALRVYGPDVKEIIDTDLSDKVVETFILAANLTITKLLGSNTDLSTAQLKEIERWLSAHFLACTREQQAKEEVAGDAEIKYQGTTGKGLDSTFYGQQCAMLDTTGTLAAELGKTKAEIYAITSFE